MARIELYKASLTFRIRPLGRITMKEFVLRHVFRRTPNSMMDIHALRDVSLRFTDGDRIGIMGHNGAGKSTLLRVLADIYPVTGGRRLVEGRISSLFDIMLGFEGEESGWENIRLRGYLQGETRRSIRAKLQPIAEFSELGNFLNMQVRHYSSGMMFRLAFAIATAIEPEILLLDEVFSVGDLAFQHKSRQRMRDMMEKARVLVMVNHDLDTLAGVCNKGVWMDHGQVRQVGPIRDVIAAYRESVLSVQPKAA
jgi:ABC-type polysaccharide/polyol phosphate transport system ATPase subunit